jgi:hypothetical protein
MIFLRTNNDNAIINRLNYHFEDLFFDNSATVNLWNQ